MLVKRFLRLTLEFEVVILMNVQLNYISVFIGY